MELILLRHGETAANEARLYCGRMDPPLSPRGEAQARGAVKALDGDFTRILVSPALRARQTASIACPGASPEVMPALREADFGAFEGLAADEIQSRYPDDWARYLADPLRFAFPGGDSMEEYMRGAAAAAGELARLEGRVLAVSHKGFIAAALAALLHGDASRLFHYDIRLAGFAALRIESGFAVLTRLN